MRIFLTGATGFIGGHLLQALQNDGHEILACARRPTANRTDIRWATFDFANMTQPADWLCNLRNIDAVINTVGIIAESTGQTFEALHHRAPAALFQACRMAGVHRVVQISALGADTSACTPYHRTKKAADDSLRDRSLAAFVLRPSLVYGRGGASTALFQALASLPLIPLVGAGRQRIQPVYIDDLVATVLTCLQCEPSGYSALDVVGPRALTYREWLQIQRRYLGWHDAPMLPIPMPLMYGLSHFGKYLGLAALSPDSLRMLQQGNTADPQPLITFLGRPPIAAERALAPRTASPEERRAARWYFLQRHAS